MLQQVALLLVGAASHLAFLAAAFVEAHHLRRLARERLMEAARLPSLACLLNAEQELAEGKQGCCARVV